MLKQLDSRGRWFRSSDEIEEMGRGVVMTMGKGGVGKTTIAAAIAVELAHRGHKVHLSTTDPAAHIAATVEAGVPGLQVSRIDPALETRRYTQEIMAKSAPQPRPAGPSAARRGSALALHGRDRRLSRVRGNRRWRRARFCCLGYGSDGPHAPLARCGRSLPPGRVALDERHARLGKEFAASVARPAVHESPAGYATRGYAGA